jgi:hypothetical protein
MYLRADLEVASIVLRIFPHWPRRSSEPLGPAILERLHGDCQRILRS